MRKIQLSFWIFILFSASLVSAVEHSLPRFVSIKSNQVNARKGPGASYPIEWVFIAKGEPVKVISEFEQWRKVQDIEGQGGWVHSSVLSPKRHVVLIGPTIQKMMSNPKSESRIVARLEPGLRCEFSKCTGAWCKIKCEGYKGWVEASAIWGILPGEN
jgi:SH3-like domain-containing protein